MTTDTKPIVLPTGAWQLDPKRTTVTISAKKLGLFTVPATLAVTSGSIEITTDQSGGSQSAGSQSAIDVQVSVDAASYTSKNGKRNDHVRGKDFLDAENHPTITFRSSRLDEGTAGYHLEGTVTIKGRSAPIDLAVDGIEFSGNEGSFTATAIVDRHAIGIDSTPNFVIGSALTLTVEAAVTRRT